MSNVRLEFDDHGERGDDDYEAKTDDYPTLADLNTLGRRFATVHQQAVVDGIEGKDTTNRAALTLRLPMPLALRLRACARLRGTTTTSLIIGAVIALLDGPQAEGAAPEIDEDERARVREVVEGWSTTGDRD